jgi:hypothetical protein
MALAVPIASNIGDGLYGLRKKARLDGRFPKNIPQGLKAHVVFVAFAARLNRLVKKSQVSHFFSTGVWFIKLLCVAMISGRQRCSVT